MHLRIANFGRLILLSLVVAALFATPANARGARPPKVTGVTATAVGEEGGVVTVRFHVRGATSCALSGPVAVIGSEWQGSCSAHHGTHLLWLAPNRSGAPVRYRLTFEARGPGGIRRRTVTIAEPGERMPDGHWLLKIVNLTPPGLTFELPVELRPDKTLSATLEGKKYPGAWSYAHGQISISIFIEEGLNLTAAGPPEGPMSDASEALGFEGKPVSVQFTKTGP